MSIIENAEPIPPTLFSEIILLFDHDFSVDQVSDKLNILPTEAKRQSETRINPITRKKNPGFWAFQTEAISSFDISPLLVTIEHFLSTHSTEFHYVMQTYSPCSMVLRIHVLVQQKEEYPSLRFNPELLQLLKLFNAAIDIDIEDSFV